MIQKFIMQPYTSNQRSNLIKNVALIRRKVQATPALDGSVHEQTGSEIFASVFLTLKLVSCLPCDIATKMVNTKGHCTGIAKVLYVYQLCLPNEWFFFYKGCCVYVFVFVCVGVPMCIHVCAELELNTEFHPLYFFILLLMWSVSFSLELTDLTSQSDHQVIPRYSIAPTYAVRSSGAHISTTSIHGYL